MVLESEESTEVSYIDCGVKRLSDLPLHSRLTSLNCHFNLVTSITNLDHLVSLKHLDLSSNQITRIQGLDNLPNLRTLNLSSNRLVKVDGVHHLKSLVKINLSYNEIRDISAFGLMKTSSHKLTYIELHGNQIKTISHVVKSLKPCQNLRHLTLSLESNSNPVCSHKDYRKSLLLGLSQLEALDGLDRRNHKVQLDILADIPGLDDFLDYIGSSSQSADDSDKKRAGVAVLTPKIDSAYRSYRQRPVTPFSVSTTEEESDVKVPSVVAEKNVAKEEPPTLESNYQNRLDHLERQLDKLLQEKVQSLSNRKDERVGVQISDTPAAGLASNKVSEGPVTARAASLDVIGKKAPEVNKKTTEQMTFGQLLRELDMERERRWKCENACRRLAEHVKLLQDQSKEDHNVGAAALEAADGLKKALADERESRSKLELQLETEREKLQGMEQDLRSSRDTEKELRRVLSDLQRQTSREDKDRLVWTSEQSKSLREAELTATRAERELTNLRSQNEAQAEQNRQLQRLLAEREQDFQTQLRGAMRLGSPELAAVIDKEIARERQSAQESSERWKEKMCEAEARYRALEDEFRLALRLESQRFARLDKECAEAKEEAAGLRELYSTVRAKEAEREKLVSDLTDLVKEQKSKVGGMAKTQQEVLAEHKDRVAALEKHLEDARRRLGDLEALRKENKRIAAQLQAQDSLIEGLRAEKRLWADELAQQGTSLAQDRGRLECRIESLNSEVANLKKQLDKEVDTVRIKTKVIEDLTDSIRKLKDSLGEKDSVVKKVQDEGLRQQKMSEELLYQETEARKGFEDKVKLLTERKEELKSEVSDLRERSDKAERALNQLREKWKDKVDVIARLEEQVEQLRAGFQQRESQLAAERDQAKAEAAKATQIARDADDAFRVQLEAKESGHRRALDLQRKEMRREAAEARTRVQEVEEELRILLQEKETQKLSLESKIRQLTSAFQQITQELSA